MAGLHPYGVVVLYGERPAAVDVALGNNRSEILGAADPLLEAQHLHWTIHHAFLDYQTTGERRRQLAAEVGELAGELIATLVAAGWSERDARTADVHELARTGKIVPRESCRHHGSGCIPTGRIGRGDDGQAAHS